MHRIKRFVTVTEWPTATKKDVENNNTEISNHAECGSVVVWLVEVNPAIPYWR